MRYRWDEEKNRANRIKHRISFEAVSAFDWDTALCDVDDRDDYGELRETAIGFIGMGLYYLVFVVQEEVTGTRRIISLRPATRAEARRYANEQR